MWLFEVGDGKTVALTDAQKDRLFRGILWKWKDRQKKAFEFVVTTWCLLSAVVFLWPPWFEVSYSRFIQGGHALSSYRFVFWKPAAHYHDLTGWQAMRVDFPKLIAEWLAVTAVCAFVLFALRLWDLCVVLKSNRKTEKQ